MIFEFNPENWYWGVEGRVYSSALSSYISPTDPAFLEWLSTGYTPTNSPSEADLTQLLDHYGLVGPIVLPKFVDAERDLRIGRPYSFAGHLFQSRLEDQKRVNGAVTLALIAISAGAQPGDLRWHGGAEDFAWLSADNVLVPMDVYDVLSFGRAMAIHESSHVFAARALKDMDPIPRDFKDNKYWP